jgi:hypothetical protein
MASGIIFVFVFAMSITSFRYYIYCYYSCCPLHVIDDHLVLNVNCVASVPLDVNACYVVTSVHHLDSVLHVPSAHHVATFHIFIGVKKEFIGIIDFIYFFLAKYDKKRTHNMLTLMLDSKFKKLILISYFIGHELGWP